jgi:hypothetical protein
MMYEQSMRLSMLCTLTTEEELEETLYDALSVTRNLLREAQQSDDPDWTAHVLSSLTENLTIIRESLALMQEIKMRNF